MTISQRANVEGHMVDVVCTGVSSIFSRSAMAVGDRTSPADYEKDRMDAIDPDPANP